MCREGIWKNETVRNLITATATKLLPALAESPQHAARAELHLGLISDAIECTTVVDAVTTAIAGFDYWRPHGHDGHAPTTMDESNDGHTYVHEPHDAAETVLVATDESELELIGGIERTGVDWWVPPLGGLNQERDKAVDEQHDWGAVDVGQPQTQK